jgi:hypothetical protein
VSDISESLREQQRHHEVADQQDGHDKPEGVPTTHSRSTPFTIKAVSAKNATVRSTNKRSDMNWHSRR